MRGFSSRRWIVMRRIMMLRWWLLLSLFCRSTQDGHGQDVGASRCEPRDVTLADSEQTLLLTWEDSPACSAARGALVYELVVLREGEEVHKDEVTVTPDAAGSTRHWNWTSDLALECASHSVRLRSRYNNQISTVELDLSRPGATQPTKIKVYPMDRNFKVGSVTTFCCVLPAGIIFERMYATGYDNTRMNVTKISSQTYALTIHLNQPSGISCTDIKCLSKTNDFENAACAYIGYPPGDEDLQCETRDLKWVQCYWNGWNDTTAYELNGRPCESRSERGCERRIQDGETKWILTARNRFGQVELSDSADVRQRVRMLAPHDVAVSSVSVRNVSVEWEWEVQQYNHLNLTCQVSATSHDGAHATNEQSGVGLAHAVVTDLLPNWAYTATVRCGAAQHFWKWGDWSASVSFRTQGDVPDALDVWMQMKDYQVIVVWKTPLANQSHGNIADYTVTWATTTEARQQNTTTVYPSQSQLPLSLEPTGEFIVTVTARNEYGSSPPSAVTIPRRNADRATVKPSVMAGSSGGFSLSWSDSPNASCGYIVDWCPTARRCSVEWLRLQEPKATIFSKTFRPGVRYSLSIYACTQGAPVLLESREGYVSEERMRDNLFEPLHIEQRDSDVEISWRSVPLAEQTAFIRGYVLYWSENNSKDNKSFSVSSADPEITKLVVKPVKIASYMFKVTAQTAVGECGTTFLTADLNPPTDRLIQAVSISLVSVFCLLSLLTILCYRHWACIKQKVYPPIPKPVLTDKWLTSPNDYNCRPLHVGLHPKSEADVMPVPELHCKSGAAVHGCDSHKKEPLIGGPTPRGYYNQSVPPPLHSPTPTTTSPSGLPASTFVGVFPNLSYILAMQSGEQHSTSELQAQEETYLESSSSGYQPQSHSETLGLDQTEETPDNPLYCVSTYILLPQSPYQ